jgi:RNA polymerase sigma factor (sigma-70 family)
MEASALKQASRRGLLARRSPLLRLQSDERLIAMIRSGHDRAFEVLFDRYHARLLAFCRHMLSSSEDAEDVLQEVFTNAHAAILGDERAINVRPWLYRIARNRCLNHLRRPVPEGQDSMDVHPHDGGTTTAEQVQQREDFRALVADVQDLPETQRSALLLREIDALSYEEIAESMDTTVPAIKSLLVRARMSLAEATQSRTLSCGDVQLELAEAAEGLRKASGPVRYHVRRCEECKEFRAKLRSNGRALASIAPAAVVIWAHKAFGTSLFGFGSGGAAGGSSVAGGAAGSGAAAASGGAATAGGGAAAAGGAATAGGAVAASGGAAAAGGAVAAATAATAGGGAAAAAGGAAGGVGGLLGSKAIAGIATAALVTAGAVEVRHLYKKERSGPPGNDVPAATSGAPSPQGAAPVGVAALGSSEGDRERDPASQSRDDPPSDGAAGDGREDATAAEPAAVASEVELPDDAESLESADDGTDDPAAEDPARQSKRDKKGRRARGSQATGDPLPVPTPCDSEVDPEGAEPTDSNGESSGDPANAQPASLAEADCAEEEASADSDDAERSGG